MAKIKLQISKAELVEGSFGGKNIEITRIKVMNSKGEYIKFAKINDVLLDKLKNAIIEIDV